MSLLQRVEAAKLGISLPAEPGAPLVSGAPVVAVPVERAASHPPAPARSRVSSRDQLLADFRARLADEVLDAWASLLDLSNVAQIRRRVTAIVDESVDLTSRDQGFFLTAEERARITDEVVHEVIGFGPIEPLLDDDSITEVMVNGPEKVYIERAGKIIKVPVTFRNEEHVLSIIDRIITPIGRRIDESSPRVDARLPDGSRVNAIIRPLSLIGPVITIRKFATRYTVQDLIRFGTATPEMFDFLRSCIEAKLNVFLSGGTGSGKTTTLNVLSSFVPEEERIITIEDAAELRLSQRHVVTLEARPANLEGRGEITIRDLLRNALHMRPDRIIVGECRAGEALDMISAMTTGQEGSLSTGHANSPEDMLRRLETMILMTGYELPMRAIREQIASAIDVIVHTARLRDGTRKIVSITEVYGIEEDRILTQDIFTFEQTAFRDGKIEGQLRPTGVRPHFMDAFAIKGITLPPGEFGIPPADPSRQRRSKSRWGFGDSRAIESPRPDHVGRGKVVSAGGMVYVTSVGPVDLEDGHVPSNEIRLQTRQCLQNLKALLEAQGSSLEQVVWATWSLRDASEADVFSEEWQHWFSDDAPLGQETVMPAMHRRAGFRVSIGAIAAL
jgi:pilus assembly protein CpaF